MSTKKVMLGIIAGAAAGAVLGMLYAPDKGSNTRKKISNKGQAYLDNGKSMYDGFLQGATNKIKKATNKLEAVKSEAEDLFDTGRAKAHEIKNEAQDFFDKGKEIAQKAQNEIKTEANKKLSSHS